MRVRTAVGAVSVALLAACSNSPAQELTGTLAKVTEAANARDAVGMRMAADRLTELVQQQQADRSIDQAEGERILALVDRVRNADFSGSAPPVQAGAATPQPAEPSERAAEPAPDRSTATPTDPAAEDAAEAARNKARDEKRDADAAAADRARAERAADAAAADRARAEQAATQRLAEERVRAEREQVRAEQERVRAEQERQRAAREAARDDDDDDDERDDDD